jgi:hypothetical protein
VLDDDHRAVLQIADALMSLFSFANHRDVQLFARQDDRLDRIGQLVDVEDRDALDVRDAIEIVIVGNEFCAKILRKSNEPCIHVAKRHVVIIQFANLEAR